jgi:hypothetical protein
MYPFFYFYDLGFDANKILEFANSIPDGEWIGPHIGNYDPAVPITEHLADGKLWTANAQQTDFFQCDEIVKLSKYFSRGNNPLHRGMMIKKSINGFRSPFHPLMQNQEFDKKNGTVRTFDVIVPIQGGFKESPLEAIDTKTNEHYVLEPKGLAFMVPNDPSWHFSWCETVYDYRYTLHLRGVMPVTYDVMKRLYHKDV